MCDNMFVVPNQDPTLVALLDTGAPPRLELGYEQREPPSVSTLSYANHTLTTTLLWWGLRTGR